MICPLCGQRKAKRACPALDKQICTVCCGTKRWTEIRCPSDCPYLATAREHPPAAVLRQHERELTLFVDLVRDFDQRQTQLFMMMTARLVRYEAPELHAIVDDNAADALAALAATFETAAKGVIYEHRPALRPAERLAAHLKPLLLEAGKHRGSAFERDAAVVLRRLERGAREMGPLDEPNRRTFLEFLARTVQRSGPSDASGQSEPDRPRLIVP